MPTKKGRVSAHVTRISQDKSNITTLVMTEAQILELMSVLTVALREKAPYPDGYHLAIWKERQVEKCTDNPPCGGGEAVINLVRLGKSEKE
jgi:hypothetical protein